MRVAAGIEPCRKCRNGPNLGVSIPVHPGNVGQKSLCSSRSNKVRGFRQCRFGRSSQLLLPSSRSGARSARCLVARPGTTSSTAIRSRIGPRTKWRSHPDKLMARGVPKEFVTIATEKVVIINEAYDAIAEERGI